jgi:hypothetical protein
MLQRVLRLRRCTVPHRRDAQLDQGPASGSIAGATAAQIERVIRLSLRDDATVRRRRKAPWASLDCRFSLPSLVALTTPHFLDAGNLSNLVLQVSIVALVAIGSTLVRALHPAGSASGRGP